MKNPITKPIKTTTGKPVVWFLYSKDYTRAVRAIADELNASPWGKTPPEFKAQYLDEAKAVLAAIGIAP